MHNSILIRRLNEARAERTIDPKLWASVSSGCSKTYKNDLGASARPIGTRDQLLQRFVAGLIILKQQCPITENDMKKCPAFNQWSNKLIEMGVTMAEVHKLWNENCGKLPKVDTTITMQGNTAMAEPEDDDDFMTGVNLDDEEDEMDDVAAPTVQTPATNNTAPEMDSFEVDTIEDEEVIDEPEVEEPAKPEPVFPKKQGASTPTAPYESDPYNLINSLHTILFGKDSQFTNLHGCRIPEESMKFFPKFSPMKEGINDCENLDDFMELASQGNVYALRVYKGGDPENVQGDCVWCEAKTETAYYIAATPSKVAIYFKDVNGDFTMAYTGNHADFGFV